MAKKYDFKKEWPRIKKELMRLSQEAMVMAKKGEKEFLRFSQKSKLQLDITALKLRQDHLCRMIGKEYLRAQCPAEPTVSLKKSVQEWNKIDKEIKDLKRKIKATSGKKTARKRSA